MLKGKTALGVTALVVAAFSLGVFGASLVHPQLGLEAAASPVRPLEAPVASESREPAPEQPVTPPDAPEVPTALSTLPNGLYAPSLGLTVPLAVIDVKNGEITPPTFDTAYVVNGYSTSLVDAAAGSIYVVFHSQRDGEGIGNKFFNQQTGEPAITTGDTIALDGTSFTVRETLSVGKDELPYRDDIWEGKPGTLYLITCLQNPQGSPSTHNFIVVADLTSEL